MIRRGFTRRGGCTRAGLFEFTSLRAIAIDEDSLGRASRLDQGKAVRRNTGLKEPLSFAENHRNDPQAIFVDELRGDERLQQFTAAPEMKSRPGRRLHPAKFGHDITAERLRVLPVELAKAARGDIFCRPIECL